ncbi:MAG: hypothetical protein RLY20_2312 [Verrucomicrobiota bacterium]
MGAGQESGLPQFLRGLFRGRSADECIASPAVDEPAEAAPVFVGEQRPKVLVVDDDPVFLKAMQMKLSKAGCNVVLAHDGPEAIALARKENPEAIILDVGLPADVSVAWDGIRVMQWIKRLENGANPPMIIVTASDSPALKKTAIECGAAAFFQKPPDDAAFVQALQAVIEKNKSASHTPMPNLGKTLNMVAKSDPPAPPESPAPAKEGPASSGFALY